MVVQGSILRLHGGDAVPPGQVEVDELGHRAPARFGHRQRIAHAARK
jgi:hypothetical protein